MFSFNVFIKSIGKIKSVYSLSYVVDIECDGDYVVCVFFIVM